MGAKTWMLVYADGSAVTALRGGHRLNRDATLQLARRLFPKDKLDPIGDGTLSFTCPPDDELYAGCFPGISILAAREFGIDHPSRLPEPFLSAGLFWAISGSGGRGRPLRWGPGGGTTLGRPTPWVPGMGGNRRPERTGCIAFLREHSLDIAGRGDLLLLPWQKRAPHS